MTDDLRLRVAKRCHDILSHPVTWDDEYREYRGRCLNLADAILPLLEVPDAIVHRGETVIVGHKYWARLTKARERFTGPDVV